MEKTHKKKTKCEIEQKNVKSKLQQREVHVFPYWQKRTCCDESWVKSYMVLSINESLWANLWEKISLLLSRIEKDFKTLTKKKLSKQTPNKSL